MIDLEPILLEAQQAKRTWCFANVDPQALIELCAEVKILRAENALLRIGVGPSPGQTNPGHYAAFCSPSTKP